MKQYIAETCQVSCVDNGKVVEADILDFKEKKTLSVSLNKTIKLVMPWNGQVFEGRMSGMTFTSKGPVIKTVLQGRS
jgi:hypothetical protein